MAAAEAERAGSSPGWTMDHVREIVYELGTALQWVTLGLIVLLSIAMGFTLAVPDEDELDHE